MKNNELIHPGGEGVSGGSGHEEVRSHETSPSAELRRRGQTVSALWSASACLLLAMLLIGCASQSSNEASLLGAMPGTGGVGPNYNSMREGDLIQVTFEGSSNLNTTVKIAFDGVINMPLIGKVKAAGKTPLELEAMLTGLYESQIKPSEISVVVISQVAVVYVYGAVLKPGKITLDRPMTFLDAVMEGGGIDHSRAKLSGVTLLRIENGRRRSYNINLKRALNGKEESLFYLQPFDIIHVPERTFNF